MKTRWKYLTALLLVLFIAAGVYFFFSANNKKSPGYSLAILQNSISSHDWATFQKHIDLKSFYGSVFNDIIAPTIRQPSDSFTDQFLDGIVQNIRTTFVDSMTEYTKEIVTKNSRDKKPALPEQIFARKFIGMIDFNNMTYKKFSNTKITGNTATIDITITNKTLNKDFLLQVRMRKLEDDTWQLEKIINIPEFLSALKKAQTEKLIALNKPLSDEIAKDIVISTNNFDIKTHKTMGLSTAFIYKPTIIFKSTEKIVEFIGQVQVLGKNNVALFTQKYIVHGPFPIGAKQDYSFSWTLNPFIPGDKVLIEANTSDLKIKETILSVEFENGKHLQTLEQVPTAN